MFAFCQNLHNTVLLVITDLSGLLNSNEDMILILQQKQFIKLFLKKKTKRRKKLNLGGSKQA